MTHAVSSLERWCVTTSGQKNGSREITDEGGTTEEAVGEDYVKMADRHAQCNITR